MVPAMGCSHCVSCHVQWSWDRPGCSQHLLCTTTNNNIQLLSCPGFCGCWGQKPVFSKVDFPFTEHWLISN